MSHGNSHCCSDIIKNNYHRVRQAKTRYYRLLAQIMRAPTSARVVSFSPAAVEKRAKSSRIISGESHGKALQAAQSLQNSKFQVKEITEDRLSNKVTFSKTQW